MIGRLTVVAMVLAFALSAEAAAQDSNRVPSDPDADSPSGTVYELPLDRARKDAAPRQRPGGNRGGGGDRGAGGEGPAGQAPSGGSPDGSSGTDSPIRSENNFGSSSQVPGLDDDTGSDDRADAGAGASSDGGSGTGTGTGSGSGGGGQPVAGLANASDSSEGSGPSWALIIPLIALLLLVGVAAGTLAGRARRT